MEPLSIDLIARSIAQNVADNFAEHRNEAEFVALSAERSRMSDEEFKAALRSCASLSLHLLQSPDIKKQNSTIKQHRQKHVDDIWGDKNFGWWCTVCEMEPDPFKATHLVRDWAVNGCPEGEESFPDSGGLLDERHVKAILEDVKNFRPLSSLKRKFAPMDPPEHVQELGQPNWDAFQEKVLDRFPDTMVEVEWDQLSFEPAYMFGVEQSGKIRPVTNKKPQNRSTIMHEKVFLIQHQTLVNGISALASGSVVPQIYTRKAAAAAIKRTLAFKANPPAQTADKCSFRDTIRRFGIEEESGEAREIGMAKEDFSGFYT